MEFFGVVFHPPRFDKMAPKKGGKEVSSTPDEAVAANGAAQASQEEAKAKLIAQVLALNSPCIYEREVHSELV